LSDQAGQSPRSFHDHWQYINDHWHSLDQLVRLAHIGQLIKRNAQRPSKIDKDGRRHYSIRAIPYHDPQQEAEQLKAAHEARVKIVPRV
jgi:hypothetical protein